jgi:general secretion pathway protein A
MYSEYFGLSELPFSIAPDPRYLYMSEQHREALAHLLYGFNSEGGFVLLTGEVGTGKTTVCRCLMDQIPENSAIALIFNPKLTVEELLATICDEFGIQYREGTTSIKTFVDLINAFLLDAHDNGRKAVLIIDEAQNLSTDVLEQLRLLTNLETSQTKLLQIILLGQPELKDKLSQPDLRQLSQRIIARYHLGSLSKNDVSAYVAHRLSVAGLRKQLFAESTINKLFHLSGGVPRLINVLCDRALLGTFAQGKNEVNKSTLVKAAREVFGKGKHPNQIRAKYAWVISVITIAVFGVLVSSTYINDEAMQTMTDNISEPPVITEEVIEESPQADRLQWPDEVPIKQSREMAFSDLFGLWEVTFQAEENFSACNQAEANGLLCYEGIGSLNKLRNLNRPAVLRMFNDQGTKYYVNLISLKKDTAVITVGSKTLEVTLKDINSRWLGNYILLWRVPDAYRGAIRPGNQNPSVRWLETMLASIQGREPVAGENMVFDKELVKKVKEFQLKEGLVPDGIVGVQTFIHLNTAANNNVPTLTQQEDKL